ncbi:MAG: hypothetical protein KAS07_03910 [Candidatus Pacebacteria bacterium]|nr:hypothetical protein [Candidatus Paceibacterota bacterium]
MENNKKIPPIPLPPKKKNKLRKIIAVILWLFIMAIFLSVALASLNTARKPAIYLYPTEDMDVQVQVDVNGILFNDIPKYNNGWDVFVTKDGIIDGVYDYLFYEAFLWKIDVPEEGWVVAYNELEEWFADMLPVLGLNEKETEQFVEYWMEELPRSKYYEVKLFDREFVDENMTLSIDPAPDTVIRLLFYFKPVEEKNCLQEPTIVIPTRDGFTVVEWGGILGE